MTKAIAHICVLVRDIDKAIKDYSKLFSIISPGLLKKKVVKQNRYAGKDPYVTAFFAAPGGGCDFQLLEVTKDSPLYPRLEKFGEGIHHMAMSSNKLEDTYQTLTKNDIPVSDEIYRERKAGNDEVDVRHFWVLPKYSHGVPIELIDDYDVIDGLINKKVKAKRTKSR